MLNGDASRLVTTEGGGVPQPARLQVEICEATAAECRRIFGDALRAVVLTGSLARHEGTFRAAPRGTRLLGDAEFIVLVDSARRVPGAEAESRIGTTIAATLAARGLDCQVHLSVVRPSYLRRLGPSIFSFELVAFGQVVDGERAILELVPRFRSEAIPLEDGWRMLCNRMVELLEFAPSLERGRRLPEAAAYAVGKLGLDLATSFLLFRREYVPGYRARAEHLARLAAGDATGWPLPPRGFADRVEELTRAKLASEDGRAMSWHECATILEWSERLWTWELGRLTGSSSAQRDELWRAWLAQQPVASRARGWLSALRAQGWRPGASTSMRWLRLAFDATPRHCVYRAGTELTFGLSKMVGSSAPPPEHLHDWVPLGAAGSGKETATWQDLASLIAWNYRRLIAGTRS